MTVPPSYAKNARRQVGQYLVEQAGYSKKTEQSFYKQGDNILTRICFQKSRGITQVHVGIVPLYMPDSLSVLNGIVLTGKVPNSILLEDDNAQQAKAWAERIIKYLSSGILAFMESISSPQSLLDYLNNRSATDRRFEKSPIQVDQLIIFSSAYLGEVSFAVEYAKAVQRKIKEGRIETLANKVAQLDEAIAKWRGDLAKNGNGNKKCFEERIRAYEREKQLATFDAEHKAPSTMQMYDKWIEPFVAPGFNSEAYFSQIVEHNKAYLKYEKLFSSREHKRR